MISAILSFLQRADIALPPEEYNPFTEPATTAPPVPVDTGSPWVNVLMVVLPLVLLASALLVFVIVRKNRMERETAALAPAAAEPDVSAHD